MNLYNHKVHLTSSGKEQWKVICLLFLLLAIPAVPGATILYAVLFETSAANTAINPTYFAKPAAILLHGGAGIIFFLTIPLQFSRRLRTKYSYAHKFMGRVAALSGCTMALAGVWLYHVVSADKFGAPYVALVLLAFLICGCFARAVICAMKKNLLAHQVWVTYAVAFSLVEVSRVILEVLVYLAFAGTETTLAVITPVILEYGRFIAMAVNILIATVLATRIQVRAQQSPMQTTARRVTAETL
ncbi:DUF2306 domain-containing protein [Pseudoalteromonas fenneropenaei]|uniref:DUF2306 domain-containing protein n=1 Tax=Pseudoalteromonas fenneropenaei TaxID=1737459 RepID=A0ABV7CES1_9GAMM